MTVEVAEAPAAEVVLDPAERTLALVEQIRAGNPQAFEQLLRIHERRVLSTAVQMGLSPADAQDACQEVFLRVFRYLAGFRIGLNFESWLWRIVVNVVYDFLRKRRDRSEISWPEEEGGESLGSTPGLHAEVENADLCRKVLARLDVLTHQERMVFVLRDLQDLETAEVARSMRISRVTVRRHGAEARKKLRQVLGDLSPKRNQ
jgi:RNA polymerase sigma-70 factor, ECF subfamily